MYLECIYAYYYYHHLRHTKLTHPNAIEYFSFLRQKSWLDWLIKNPLKLQIEDQKEKVFANVHPKKRFTPLIPGYQGVICVQVLAEGIEEFKKFMKDAGAQNTKAMKNPNAMKNLARWQQAMKDVSESPFAGEVSKHMLARELLRQRQAAADSPMKAMKAMKVAKKLISVSINAAAAKKAMKATTKTKAMKATKQLPKKETEETASSGSDSSSDSSDTGSDSD